MRIPIHCKLHLEVHKFVFTPILNRYNHRCNRCYKEERRMFASIKIHIINLRLCTDKDTLLKTSRSSATELKPDFKYSSYLKPACSFSITELIFLIKYYIYI